MKCCFCGSELEKHYYEYENGHGDTCYGDSGMLVCGSCGEGCITNRRPMLPEIWQALIDGKAAQDALNEAIRALGLVGNGKADEQGICRFVDERNCESVRTICRNALEEIASITTQEK